MHICNKLTKIQGGCYNQYVLEKWYDLLYTSIYKIKKTSEEVFVAHTVLPGSRRFEMIFI